MKGGPVARVQRHTPRCPLCRSRNVAQHTFKIVPHRTEHTDGQRIRLRTDGGNATLLGYAKVVQHDAGRRIPMLENKPVARVAALTLMSPSVNRAFWPPEKIMPEADESAPTLVTSILPSLTSAAADTYKSSPAANAWPVTVTS